MISRPFCDSFNFSTSVLYFLFGVIWFDLAVFVVPLSGNPNF
jgi:hypothetical protein